MKHNKRICHLKSGWREILRLVDNNISCWNGLKSSLPSAPILVNTVSCNGLLSDGTKPLPEPKLTCIEISLFLTNCWLISTRFYTREYPRQLCRLGWRWLNVGTTVPTLDQHCSDSGIHVSKIKLFIHKSTPYLALTSELWSVSCEDLRDINCVFNGTAMYDAIVQIS